MKFNKKLLVSCFCFMFFCLSTSVSAQTVKPYITDEWPDSRYTDNGDETITDTKTDLMWKVCSEGLSDGTCSTGSITAHTWKEALELANSATDANYTDWRLPNIKELATLVALNRVSPAINSSIFPNTGTYYKYWSSSPKSASYNSWGVDFGYGSDSWADRVDYNFIRLVRAGR